MVEKNEFISRCVQISYLFFGSTLVMVVLINCWKSQEKLINPYQWINVKHGNDSEFETDRQKHIHWVQLEMNRFKSKIVAEIIKQESVARENFKCNVVLPDCPLVFEKSDNYVDVDSWLKEHENETTLNNELQKPNCTARHSVAIIIPYRDRLKHLNIILKYLPPILEMQHIKYKIFVIEQVGNDSFNKGTLMNAGFRTVLELAKSRDIYHCFIFHDVDLLPENNALPYTCPEKPRHLLPYNELAGGVFVIRTEQFIEVNGYSNNYWGWGGEDDDMGKRVLQVMKYILRPPAVTARYKMLHHQSSMPTLRFMGYYLRTAETRYVSDGLSDVDYKLVGVRDEKRHTRVLVDVGQAPRFYMSDQDEVETNVTS